MSGKIIRRILSIILAMCVSTQAIKAQTAADTAKAVALNFFRTYDSIPYLTFDVKFTLFSDTVYSDFSHESTSGTYTMSGKKAKYSLGDVEYLQNDSVLVAVYHNDQVMVVSDPPAGNAGNYVPMRDALDSLLYAYTANYDIYVKSTSTDPDTDTTGYIRLVKKTGDTVAVYNKYLIEFDIAQNLITKVEFEYTKPGEELTSVDDVTPGQMLLKNTPRRMTMRINFLNYRFDNFSSDIYSETNFVWEEDGVYKPVEKYINYKVYSARN